MPEWRAVRRLRPVMSACVRDSTRLARWPVPLEAGSTFAGFRSGQKIGEGDGRVYLVEHPRRRVKNPQSSAGKCPSDDEYRQRFETQTELASTLAPDQSVCTTGR